MRILIVEDDDNLAGEVKAGLEESGYGVDRVADGGSGVEMAGAYTYDLIILDIMLPVKDGLAVCSDVRAGGIKTPILMLTARQREDDRVRGLDCGADDYLVKPFSYPELYARVRALLRRVNSQPFPEITIGELTLNTTRKRVYYNGKEIELTAKEYGILEYLVFNHDGVVTREMLEEHVWDCDHGAFSNVIEVLISRIRKKLDPENTEAVIKTVKGLGYVIKNEKP
jgi:two-component system, OmpR family, copper resistance phosphate regulon response regulator CusR